jgi:hypothetical protein
MKLFIFLLFIALSANAANNPAFETMNSKWKELVQPKLSSPLKWEPRLTSPIPIAWPMHGSYVVYYAYARAAKSPGVEVEGQVWAKMASTPEGGVNFLLLTDEMKKHGIRKVSVATEKGLEPLNLLSLPRSPDNDQKIREYYCHQMSLGNIPKDIESLHKPFFQWLACK